MRKLSSASNNVNFKIGHSQRIEAANLKLLKEVCHHVDLPTLNGIMPDEKIIYVYR